MKKPNRRKYGTGSVFARRKGKDGPILTWAFKFYQRVPGGLNEQVVRNCNTTDKTEAERLLAIALGEQAKGVRIERKVLTFKQAIENVENANTADNRTTNYAYEQHLLPAIGASTPMANITTPLIRRYIRKRQDAEAANATINRELSALSRTFTQAMKDGVLFAKPYIPHLKEDNARVGFFTDEEYQRLLAAPILGPKYATGQAVRDVIITLYETGWRLYKEVLALRWRQVDLTVGEVRLDPDSTKNREGRVVGMTADLRQVFERRWAVRQARQKKAKVVAISKTEGADERVFTKKNGQALGSFRKRWAKAIKQAKIAARIKRLPDGTTITQQPIPHDFRRTAIRNMDRAGVPREVAKRISGHKTDAVYARYRIVSHAEVHEAARTMERARSGRSS